jgi:hypothetical protein
VECFLFSLWHFEEFKSVNALISFEILKVERGTFTPEEVKILADTAQDE